MDPPRPVNFLHSCGFRMWRTSRNCGREPLFCGANCGTRRMSNFLRRTSCAALNAGHRTLPPINQRPGRKAGTKRSSGIRQERRSTPQPRLRRRPGDGAGGVGEPVGSRRASPHRLEPRASWCSYHREALTPLFRVEAGPAGFGAGTEFQPACRRGPGPRTPKVRRKRDGNPEMQPACRRRRGSEGRLVLIPPGDSHNSDRLPACRRDIGAELE
jgi:hypothetical protein